jgi:putative ABC transport system substrate-binding protein
LAPIERANVAAARAAGLTPQVLKVRGPNPDLETAFKSMVSERAEAVVVLEVPATIADRKHIAELAAQHRLPTMFWGGASDSGGLLSYGTSFTADFPRVPNIIDKILKGANPADTPFEVVSQRQLAINLKTARGLGLAIPAELLKRADRVIE